MKEVFVALLFLLAIGGLVWAGSHWQRQQAEGSDTRPSIGVLSSEATPVESKEKVSQETAQTEAGETQKNTTPVETKTTVESAKLELKVMNGGAPKGTAVKVQTALKTAGYAKAETGNTKADYTGTTVYYLDGFKDAAEQVKQALAKDYPNVSTKAADPKKEEGIASVTVVMGK